MTENTAKITIHMVASLDGFIAKKDADVSWMNSTDNYEKGVTLTDEYVAEFLNSIDCYLMGSGTYEHALELGWPYGETPVFVLTNRDLNSERKSVEFLSGNLNKIVTDLKSKYQNIWMTGGSMLTKEFIRLDLADEIVITLMPIILGDGLLFFDYVGVERKLHLKDVVVYKNGMSELTYRIKN